MIAGVIASNTFIYEFHPNAVQSGLVVSLFTVGAVVGAGFAGPLGDRLGRRATLTAGSLVFLLGGSVQTAAQSLAYLYGGRFVAGVGVGILTMIVPLYQAELAHPNIRGRVNSLVQFMLGIGSFLAAWITYGTFIHLKSSSAQWRIPLGLQNTPTIFLASLIWLFPESPRCVLPMFKQLYTASVCSLLQMARGSWAPRGSPSHAREIARQRQCRGRLRPSRVRRNRKVYFRAARSGS